MDRPDKEDVVGVMKSVQSDRINVAFLSPECASFPDFFPSVLSLKPLVRVQGDENHMGEVGKSSYSVGKVNNLSGSL